MPRARQLPQPGDFCTRCKRRSDTVEPVARHSGAVVRQQLCSECLAALAPAANRPSLLNRELLDDVLRQRYGIGTFDYEAMLVRQDGRCYICRSFPPDDMRLAVDHDHQTGGVRGLLCLRCNRAIGLLDDSPELLLRAAAYLYGVL